MWLSLARAPGLGPGGRRFESCHPDSDMREWLSWWSTTLPRSGPRVRVPSRALFICSGSLDFTGTSAVFVLSVWGRVFLTDNYIYSLQKKTGDDRLFIKGGGEYVLQTLRKRTAG